MHLLSFRKILLFALIFQQLSQPNWLVVGSPDIKITRADLFLHLELKGHSPISENGPQTAFNFLSGKFYSLPASKIQEKVNEFFKEIICIMGTRASLWMVLYREKWKGFML